MIRSFAITLLAASMCMLATTLSYGQAAGSLDKSFAGNGIYSSNLSFWEESLQAMAIQSDGKIVCAGYIIMSSGTAAEFLIIRLKHSVPMVL